MQANATVDELMRQERPGLHERLLNWGRAYRDLRPSGVSTTGLICQRLIKANLVMDSRLPAVSVDYQDAAHIQRAWVSMRSDFGVTRNQAALVAYYVQGRAPVRAVLQELMRIPGPQVTASTFAAFVLASANMLDKQLSRLDNRGTT